jgi:deazaflavin-dependent oxidoreductase (nitroreductase family)
MPAIPTDRRRALKHRLVNGLQQRLLNPPVRWLLAHDVQPPGYVLLETRGRTSGQRRRTPVGDGRVGDVLWIVAEHGERSGYVRNLRADPHVRVKLRRGVHSEWRDGIAKVLPDDDPRARQRRIAQGHPGRALNALAVRTMGTDLLTVRIDLR